MTVAQFLESIVPALESLAGSQEPWEARRDAFVGQLGELGLSDHPVAARLVERLDAVSDDERATMLASREFGIAEVPGQEQDPLQPAAASAEQPGEAGYDEQAWQAYLAENGPAWDGATDSWDQFVQWFSYHAAEGGLRQPATALMDYLDGQSASERVSTFAQYGVSIGQAEADEPVPDEDIDDMMRQLLDEHPEYAEIPEEDRRKLIIEAFNEASDDDG